MSTTTPTGLLPAERLALEALSSIRLLPGSWDKRFIRNLATYSNDRALSPKQREHLWRIVQRYRRQLPGEVAALGTEGQKLLVAERKGYAREGLDFELALHDHPDDWDLRLVYADYLQEQGDEVLAAGQRWQVRERKSPLWYCSIGTHGSGLYRWWWLFKPARNSSWEYAELPKDLWLICHNPDYLSRRAAERALAEALQEI